MWQKQEPGVLGCDALKDAIERGWIRPIGEEIEPGASAIDLALDGDYWIMPGSVRPLLGPGKKVEALLSRLGRRKSVRRAPVTLQVGKVYVFRLAVTLELPTLVTGRATGKSSIGRLDVLTRLLCDGGRTFDEVPAGYSGPLFVEIVPNSFAIAVTPLNSASAVNQLRLFWGEPRDSRLRLRDALLLSPDGRVLYEHLPFHGENLDSDLVGLRVNLRPARRKWAAFLARNVQRVAPKPIDLTSKAGAYSGTDYWDTVPIERTGGPPRIHLRPDRFYILASRERFLLPRTVCVECRAYQETLGEYRIHYAGFVHPEFGKGRPNGTPLILEVRPHSADALLFGHEPVANVEFYRMAEETEGETSYARQELTLSKYFSDDFA